MPARARVKFIEAPDAATLRGIITIYRAHGWWKPGDKPALLKKIIKGSHCFAVAETADRIIGMGRAISDGVSDAYIQDMAVLDTERGSGAGSALLKAIMKRLKKDGVKWVGLIAQDNSEYFYRKAGFKTLAKAHPMLSKESYV
ncbi:MAG: GNAT family N-acetyltransferase [Elusimicrobiales bacterium]|nr:GNAT family N-acetyltransferase [Elusimicrobiales bacterium]